MTAQELAHWDVFFTSLWMWDWEPTAAEWADYHPEEDADWLQELHLLPR